MNRELKTIETPVSKQKVEILSYVTGLDKRNITSVYFGEGMQIDPETKQVKSLKAELVNAAQDAAIKTVVVSIDDNKEDVLTKILSMRLEDFNFVVSEINKVTGDDKFEQKKTS